MDDQLVSNELQGELDQIGRGFMIRFMELELLRRPGNIDAMMLLGEELTRAGRYEEGLRVDLKLCATEPGNPTFHYNLGCSHALLGNKDEALDALREAVRLGFNNRELFERDVDLASLHDDPRFESLLQELSWT